MLSDIMKLYSQFSVYVTAGLIALCVALGTGWYVTDAKLETERALRKADKTAYETAQKAYELEAFKQRVNREKAYAENSKESAKKYDNLRAEYARNLVRFQAAQSEARRLASAAQNRGAGVPARASEGAEILITTSDGLICAENTAKLKAAQEWALKLKDVK